MMGVPYTYRVPECLHEDAEYIPFSSDKQCPDCGAIIEFDGDMDDGRDHTPPYEP